MKSMHCGPLKLRHEYSLKYKITADNLPVPFPGLKKVVRLPYFLVTFAAFLIESEFPLYQRLLFQSESQFVKARHLRYIIYGI